MEVDGLVEFEAIKLIAVSRISFSALQIVTLPITARQSLSWFLYDVVRCVFAFRLTGL